MLKHNVLAVLIALMFFVVPVTAEKRLLPLHFDLSGINFPRLIHSVGELADYVKIKRLGVDEYGMTYIVKHVDLTLSDLVKTPPPVIRPIDPSVTQDRYAVYVQYKREWARFSIISPKEGATLYKLNPSLATSFLKPSEIFEIVELAQRMKDSSVKDILEAMRSVGRK